jgi:putative flippase GtrA
MRIGSRSLDRYVLVGLLNTATDFVGFSLLAVVVGLPPVLANVISTVCVMTMSFFLNRAWVFRSEASGVGTFVRFVGVTLFSGLLVQSAVIVTVLAFCDAVLPSLAGEIAAPGAKLTAMAVGMVVNFLGYRWLFAAPEQADGRRSPSAGSRSPDRR